MVLLMRIMENEEWIIGRVFENARRLEKDRKNDEGVLSIPGIVVIGEIQSYGPRVFPS